MTKWAKKRNIEWAIDASKTSRTIEHVNKFKPEDAQLDQRTGGGAKPSLFPFLIRTTNEPKVEQLK